MPAKVQGRWTTPNGDLTLTQTFQTVAGRLGSTAISGGKLRGTEITFTAGGTKYVGQVNGNSIKGTTSAGGSWTATKRT